MGSGSDARKKIRRRWRARLAIGLNTGVALALMAVLMVMLNYLAARHHVRADLSRTKYYQLSGKTLSLLESLTNTVRVIVFFQPGQDVYQDVEYLLREYEYASSRVRIEWVDPDRDLARAEELLKVYDVAQPNVVVFDAGGRSKYVGPDDIVEYDYEPMRFGQPPRRVAFKGEQAFSSAIQNITQARKPVVYFLQGHGERDLEDHDPRTGYSALKRAIERDNIEVRTLQLGEVRAVPAEADALIIGGPKRRISRAELDVISDYVEQNGRLLVLVDAMDDTGLDDLLLPWGVRVGNDIVVDASRTLSGRELFVTEYGAHPITERLKGVTSIFYIPRSVEPLAGSGAAGGLADKPRVTVLASCSASGWAESDLTDGRMKFDPEWDLPGPVGVAVAVEKGAVPGINVQIQPTRIVAVGDSDFVSNGALTGGDLDFFMSALNWLLERETLMAIAPKPIEESRLVMSARDLALLFWAVVVGLPAGVAVIGLLVWWRRRK
ncbi:MAG: GldG family protein [Kiritimatiellae bacterium]|nr:GldG family protein [Kiritimatiellia bacterium]